MTLREFIMNESCCNKKCAAKDFEDEKDMEPEVKDEGGKFDFKVRIEAENEEEAKKILKDAIKGVGKLVVKKESKENKPADEDEPMDEEHLEEGAVLNAIGTAIGKKLGKKMADILKNDPDYQNLSQEERYQSDMEALAMLKKLADFSPNNKAVVDRYNKAAAKMKERREKLDAGEKVYAKKFKKEGVCPQCGKKFSECKCC